MAHHEVSAKQKGRIGEVLLSAHGRYGASIVESWITEDLRATPEVSSDDSIRVTHDSRTETYYVNFEGRHMSWTPDCLFSAWVSKAFGPLQSSDEQRIDYPIEVKTGEYAELERNQRSVMELLATESSVTPVIANIGLRELPERFDVEFRRIPPREPGE